jgi:hypothetical protein
MAICEQLKLARGPAFFLSNFGAIKKAAMTGRLDFYSTFSLAI